MEKLLTRDAFREAVFERDGHRCVFCEKPAQDAHHVLERRLWPNGGYYLSNGISVCGPCHLRCESTELSVEDARREAGITSYVIPPHLYDDQVYDKWGNPVLENGQRLRGELFNDESVQKVIAPFLHLFSTRVKYPRTYHLPWSQNMNSDDRMIESARQFDGKDVVVTVKMDGENTTMYRDYIHARSIDGRSHPSRDWVKKFHSSIAHDIPEGWRICGENLFAEHSIHYDDLPSYFLGFSIWNDENVCLSWDDTMEWFSLLGIKPVHKIVRGSWNDGVMYGLHNMERRLDTSKVEGYVVRNSAAFHYKDFRNNVAKWVRKDHIQTVKHWMHGQPIVPNELRKDE